MSNFDQKKVEILMLLHHSMLRPDGIYIEIYPAQFLQNQLEGTLSDTTLLQWKGQNSSKNIYFFFINLIFY